MIIVIGSKNPVKIAAVEAVFQPYGLTVLRPTALTTESSVVQHIFRGVPAKSGVREQPLSMDETISGAIHRAWDAMRSANAYRTAGLDAGTSADIAIGLESGVFTMLIEIDPNVVAPGATGRRRMFDVCACAILKRGEDRPSIGLSSAWEVPAAIASMLSPSDLLAISHPIDMDEAFFRAGLTREKKLGHAEGAIGLLSKGRITRQAYTQQAIEAALIAMNQKVEQGG